MINVEKVLSKWHEMEYSADSAFEELTRLVESMWALYENGCLTHEEMSFEEGKAEMAYELYTGKSAFEKP